MHASDAELVERSRGRDAAAFGALVERHQGLVFGVAFARCRDQSLAEDAAQDAFVVAWRDLDRLRDADRVGSWIAGIARNLASVAARRRAHEADPTPPVDAAPSPQDEVIEREDRDLLRHALADVPVRHREVLVLYYLEGRSIARIAAGLGIKEDVVKQRLTRGRRALRAGVAARIESALDRVRAPGPAFGAGVVAAIAALRTGKAAAAPAAVGKVMIVMTANKPLVVAAATAALALGGSAAWVASEDSGGAPSLAHAATHATATATPPPKTATTTAAPDRPRVRKMASPERRESLLQQIQAARQRRVAASTAASGGASSTGTGPTIPEGSEAEYVLAATQEIMPLLKECYAAGLDRDPALAGKLMVELSIEGEPGVGGVVGSSTIRDDESTIHDPAVDECIRETMYALEMDPPANGGRFTVTTAFQFSPDGPPAD